MIQGVQKAHQLRSQSFSLLTYPNVRSGGFTPSGLADEPSERPGFAVSVSLENGAYPLCRSGNRETGDRRPETDQRRTHFITILVVSLLILPGVALSTCREESFASQLVPPAYAAQVDATIRYFGHNFFQILTGKGTSIATDPLAPGMYPDPQISADVVTVGREHINHNHVPIIRGTPQVLRGLRDFGIDWNRVRVNVKDLFVYNIPIYQNGFDQDSIRGAAFVFDLGRLCIAHLGDLGHQLTPRQLKWIGKIDVALTPISGRWTMGPYTAREVIKQLKPKIAIPMHYRDNMHLVRAFAEGFPSRHLKTNVLQVSKSSLPSATEIVVLTPPGAVSWE